MSSLTAFPQPRVLPNAAHACGGIFRLGFARLKTPAHWLTLAGAVALLGLVCVAFLTAGNGPRVFLRWSAGFYFTFLVPLVAFILGAGAVRDDLRAGAVDYVFTRPIRRPAFILFKYLAQVICVQIDFFVAFLMLAGVAAYRHVPDLSASLPYLLLGQALMILAFTALGFLCGILTSRYIVIGLAYGAIIELSVGQIPTQLSRLSMTHQVHTMLMARFDPAFLQAVAGGAGSGWFADQSPLTVTGLTLAYATLMLALAAGAFALQELAGAGPREG